MKRNRILSILLAVFLSSAAVFAVPIHAQAASTEEEVLSLYANAVNNMLNMDFENDDSLQHFLTKEYNTSMGAFRGDNGMLALTGKTIPFVGIHIGNVVKGFLGEGNWHYSYFGFPHGLLPSALTLEDILSAEATVDGDGVTSLTILVKGETNPQYGSSAIGHFSEDFPTEDSVNTAIDSACRNELYGLAKRGPDGIHIGTIGFTTRNVKIIATVDADGNFISLQHSYDFTARLEDVSVKIASIHLGAGEWGEVDGTRTMDFFVDSYEIIDPPPQTFFDWFIGIVSNFFSCAWDMLLDVIDFFSTL